MLATCGMRAATLTLALLAAGLSGCTATTPSPPGSDRYIVEQVRLTHRVTFVGGSSELNPAQHYELATFLDESDPDRRASIYLDAQGAEKSDRIDAVAAALGGLGRESAGTGGGEGAEHGVTVTLLQDVVLPEACLTGDGWPQPGLPPAGCAQALTFVRMLENQDDLIRGREMGPAMSATAARAAARHYGRQTLPAPAEERPASLEPPETTPTLPPAPLTRDASY
jgi:type IV pilus biogenesis protein CpaD/CtpE